MGRKSKYESHVKPHLKDIPKWYETQTEAQIYKRLGISNFAWEKYKREHPELLECLRQSKESFCEELKGILKKKALGFNYTEKKVRTIDNGESEPTIITDVSTKYAAPDTGAIHLLLKNLDDDWRNDDKPTYELKKKQTEIMQQKADQAEW